jgi:hypothetical protein
MGQRMDTIYDLVSVALFLCLVAAFLLLTDRQPTTVSRLLISGVAIAVGNQLGNAGQGVLAAALFLAGVGYAFIIVRAHPASKA